MDLSLSKKIFFLTNNESRTTSKFKMADNTTKPAAQTDTVKAGDDGKAKEREVEEKKGGGMCGYVL